MATSSCPSHANRSVASYFGTPYDVMRWIEPTSRLQPIPTVPFPWPLSYRSARLGAKPAVPGGTSSATLYVADPVLRVGSNCSPRPLIVPGPPGRLMTLGRAPDFSARADPPSAPATASAPATLANRASFMVDEQDD